MSARGLVLPSLLLLLAGRAQARPCSFYSTYGPGVYNLSLGGFDATFVQKAQSARLAGLRVGFRVDTQKSWDAQILSAYDQVLQRAYAGGFDVLGLVSNEAVANAGQSVWNAPPSTPDGRNAYTQMFVDVTKILFDRYGDQIKYWEIWNEPNACTSSDSLSVCEANPTTAGGSFMRADLYAKLLAEVYVQNKAVILKKGLHLVTGGLYAHDVGGNGVVYAADDYMEEVYANGVWTWFQQNEGRHYAWDAFGYHVYTTLYGPPVSAATISAYYDRIAAERARHGDSSPIFVTEFGWLTSQVSPAQQAQNLDTELTVLEGRRDIGRTFVFRASEWMTWGIFDGNWNPKPAVAVFQRHASGCQAVPLPSLPMDMAPPEPHDLGAADAAPATSSDGGVPTGGSASDDGSAAPVGGAPDPQPAPVGDHGRGCSFAGGPVETVPLLPLLLLGALSTRRRARPRRGSAEPGPPARGAARARRRWTRYRPRDRRATAQ